MIINKRREIDPIKQYEIDKKICSNDLVRYTEAFNEASRNFNDVKRRYPRKSSEYKEAYIEIERWRYFIDQTRRASKFIRPNNIEDIEYRDYIFREFSKRVQAVAPRDLDLRFHGTPIYNAEAIIKSKSLTSTVDRYHGFAKSTDVGGEISASTLDKLANTIMFYSDVRAYERSLPCGCVFALLPKSRRDYLYHDTMKAIDFNRNPEQLYAIFTTPENVESVKTWMHEAQLNPEKVYTFEQFIQLVQESSLNLNNDSTPRKIPSNFSREEMKRISLGRQMKPLAQLQSKLKSIFNGNKHVSRREKDEDGTSRD